jgi:hypothetical protein
VRATLNTFDAWIFSGKFAPNAAAATGYQGIKNPAANPFAA